MPASRNTPTGTPVAHSIQVMGVGPDVVADVEDLRDTDDARPNQGDGIYWDETLQLWIYRPFAAGDLPAHAPRHMDPLLDPIELLNVAGSAYRYLQDYVNSTGSAGRFSGGAITDNGDGTVTVAAGEGMAKTADNNLAPTAFIRWNATILPMVNNSMNHIYVQLLAGVVSVHTTPVEANINGHTQFEDGHVYRRGLALRISAHGPNIEDSIHHVSDRAHASGHIRTDGLEVTETGVRYVYMTAGHIWAELTELLIPLVDTNPVGAADTFTLWYHVAGVLTPFVGTAQVPNANYDNGVNAVALTPNRYGVYWVFICECGTMDVVMGRGDYTLNLAQGSTIPHELPPEVLNMGTLIARIIVQQGAGAFLEIAWPWDVPLGWTSAHTHTHASTTGQTTDDHHAQVHTHTHASTTGRTANDHHTRVHGLDSIVNHTAPTDIPAFNVSITAHGLAPKLPNDATQFLNGVGAYAVPPGAGISFGAWTNLDSDTNALVKDAVYQVTSDGFVASVHTQIQGYMYAYTDGADPPTTLKAASIHAGASFGSRNIGVNFPVKSGDYWKITSYGLTGETNKAIYWIPIGSGECEIQP